MERKQRPSRGQRLVHFFRILSFLGLIVFFSGIVIPSLQSTARYFEAVLFVMLGLWWISHGFVLITQFRRNKQRIPWYQHHDLTGAFAALLGGLDAFIVAPSLATRMYTGDVILVLVGIAALIFFILANTSWKPPQKETEAE